MLLIYRVENPVLFPSYCCLLLFSVIIFIRIVIAIVDVIVMVIVITIVIVVSL